MAYTGPGHLRYTMEARPHIFDPIAYPELFEGLPTRRVLAFMIDMFIVAIPVMFASIFIFLFGLVTFGLGWALFLLLTPAAMVWAILYYGFTMGGPRSATIGMRLVDLEIRTWNGAPCNFLLGAVHGSAFWVLISALTPLVLLAACFNKRRQLLHDILLGTVVVNNERRVAAIHRYGWGTANGL